MVRQVSFTRPGTRGTGQNDALVAALLRQVLSGRQITHPLQGFDQLGKAALAAVLQRKDDDKETARQEGVSESFADFARLNQGTPAQSVAPSLADSTPGAELSPGGGFSVPGVSGDNQAAVAALLQNPDTASLGLQLLVQGDERKFATREREAAENAARGLQGDRLGAAASEGALGRGSTADLQAERLASNVSEGGLNRAASTNQAALALALTQSEGALNRGSSADLQAARLGSAGDLQAGRLASAATQGELGRAATATQGGLNRGATAGLQSQRLRSTAEQAALVRALTQSEGALGRQSATDLQAGRLQATAAENVLGRQATAEEGTLNRAARASEAGAGRAFITSERVAGAGTTALAVKQAQGFLTSERRGTEQFKSAQAALVRKAAADLAKARQAFDAAQPGSTAGKQVNDRRKLIREFGAGSSELKNFDALVTSGAAVNVQLPDNSFVLGRKRQDGRVETQTPDGTFTLAPKGSKIVGLNIAAESVGALTPLSVPPPADSTNAASVDLAGATGGSGFFGGALNTLTDMIGIGLNEPNIEKAAAVIRTLGTQTVLILGDEVTGKPSKFIQEKIDALQATAGSILQGDERSKIKFQEVRDLIANRAQDLRSLVEQRSEKRPEQGRAIIKLQKTERLLAEYDGFLENFGRGGGLSPSDQAELVRLRAKQGVR